MQNKWFVKKQSIELTDCVGGGRKGAENSKLPCACESEGVWEMAPLDETKAVQRRSRYGEEKNSAWGVGLGLPIQEML